MKGDYFMKKVLMRVSESVGETFTAGDSTNIIILLYTDAIQEGLNEFPIEFVDKPIKLFESEPHLVFDSDYLEKHPGGKLYILKENASSEDYKELKKAYEEGV